MDFTSDHVRRRRQTDPVGSQQSLGFEPDPDVEARAHHRFKSGHPLLLALVIPLLAVMLYGLYEYRDIFFADPAIVDGVTGRNEVANSLPVDPLPDEDLASTESMMDQSPSLSEPKDPFTSSLTPTSVIGVTTPTTVDEAVFVQLQKLGIAPANLCSDAAFLRRAFLATLGTIPTVDEARQFLDDEHPEKRSRLIDELLERPEFADYAAMKWCDILRVKAEFPIKLWPQAAQAYHRWIRTAIEHNMPYDQFVYELLTSSGSNFRTPQVNFYRAVQEKEPAAFSQAVALAFLGQRVEHWDPTTLSDMNQFFSQIGFKPTGEWKEEIVYFDLSKSLAIAPEFHVVTFPDGHSVSLVPGEDPRLVFADWLTSHENEAFSRAIVNRVWSWIFGRGIVHEPDDIRLENPPVNQQLLDLLTEEFIASGFDFRQLYRLILQSETFQLSCVANSEHPEAMRNFAYFPTRRLEAEVLIDIICKITGTTEVYSSIIPEPFTFLPENQRAVALPDGSITSSFLEMFGRPARDTGLESERNNQFSAAQALHLLNSNHIRKKIEHGPAIIELMYGNSTENIYLAVLSRLPTDDEYDDSLSVSVYGPDKKLVWALINSDEFLFQH